jgi:hypothetical protein
MSVDRSAPVEPTVSIVLTTTPGPRLTGRDRQQLDRLIERVSGYLRGYTPDTIESTLGRLRALADQGLEASVESALQLTVGPGIDEIKQLPTARADRVILEPSAAPVRTAEPADTYVLVLADHEVRLFDAVGGALYEVRNVSFPLRHPSSTASPRPFRDRHRGGRQRQASRQALFGRADAALDRYISTRPAPLVVVGLSRHLRLFRDITQHADLIIAEVSGHYGRTPPSDLAPIVNRRLAARRAI